LAISKLKAEADLAQVLNITQIKQQVKVEFNNSASKELKGPNIFKALEHVSFKAKISLSPQQRLVVLLDLPADIHHRRLFNELTTFMTAASDIIQR
jgi:transcription-repair coupling factor (superfamily II helicase)